MNQFSDELSRLLSDAAGKFDHVLAVEAATGPELTVRKWSHIMPVSCCQLTDATGENHCDHEPPPPIPWRRRAYWRLRERWSDLRLRVGSWIAGRDLEDYE